MTTCPKGALSRNRDTEAITFFPSNTLNISADQAGRVLGILNISGLNPELPPEDIGNQQKERLYGYYRQISGELLIYIHQNAGVQSVFGPLDIEGATFEKSESALQDYFKSNFKRIRTQSSLFIEDFFKNTGESHTDFDTSRYSVKERFRRSITNVHFVSYMYLYCYFILYKAQFGVFPDMNRDDQEHLVQQTKNFGYLMATRLEIGVQMSFLRTIFGEDPLGGISKDIRQDNAMIFPQVESAGKAFILSPDGKHLEVNVEAITDTRERLECARHMGHFSLIGEKKGCPAHPSTIVEITRYMEGELRQICANFGK